MHPIYMLEAFLHIPGYKKNASDFCIGGIITKHLGQKNMPPTLMLEAYMDNASDLGVSGNILLPLTLVSEALFA